MKKKDLYNKVYLYHLKELGCHSSTIISNPYEENFNHYENNEFDFITEEVVKSLTLTKIGNSKKLKTIYMIYSITKLEMQFERFKK